MKIICIDNFDRETKSDILICDSVTDYWGTLIVKLLNQNTRQESDQFFRLVTDDYKLYKFEP